MNVYCVSRGKARIDLGQRELAFIGRKGEEMKCNNCLNARMIISENGMHPLCCLSKKESAECILGKANHQVSLTKREDKTDINTGDLR